MMVFSYCRTYCVSMLFLVFWTEQRGITTGTPQRWKECRYEKTNRFFLQSRQYAWRQKVVWYCGYTTQPNLVVSEHVQRGILGRHLGNTLISSEVKNLCLCLPVYSLVWLSWPFNRGFLFLWVSHTQSGLPAWEGRRVSARGKPST